MPAIKTIRLTLKKSDCWLGQIFQVLLTVIGDVDKLTVTPVS